ncbi:MAG: CopG family transcriptional regulator [Dehalococcoidia bacterium]
MTRTTITISEETLALYRQEARERGVSMATLMREVLEGKRTIIRPKPGAYEVVDPVPSDYSRVMEIIER